MNTFELTLDLDKRFTNEPVRLRQGDTNGTAIQATIYDHGTLLTGSYTARFVMLLPDREHYYRKSATYADGVATLTIDETQAASVVGTTDVAYFQIMSGSTVIASTQGFTVRILPSATANATVAESYDDAIQAAIDALDTATAAIPSEVVDEVDAWLAAHPEATTTVQDNSVTDAKLVRTGGVLDTVARLAESLLTRTTGPAYVHTSTDATPVLAGMTVFGESTQDGTPTPDAPVAIESVGPDADGGVVLEVGQNWIRLPYNSNRGAGTELDYNGIHYVVNADASITMSGTATGNSGLDLITQVTPMGTHRGLAYTFSVDNPSVQIKSYINGGSNQYSYGSRTITIPKSGGWNFGFRVPSGTTINATVRFQLELGTVAHPWHEPSAPVTIPIDLQGRSLRSLPDGTCDTVTVGADGRAVMAEVTWNDTISAVGTINTSGQTYYASITCTNQSTHRRNWDSSADFASEGGSSNDFAFCSKCGHVAVGLNVKRTWNGVYAYAPATLGLTQDDFNALVGAEIVIRNKRQTIDLGYIDPASLPAPDLTAAIVPTAPSTLTVGRDPVAAFTRLAANLAPVESSPATANHARGSLMTLDGQLVKATAAIAIGETIAIGTNVQATDVATELAALA